MLTTEMLSAVKSLWADTGIKDTFARRKEYQLNDSAPYYFDNIDRIASSDFLPTDQDILRCRVKTVGIIETKFSVGSMIYRYDFILLRVI